MTDKLIERLYDRMVCSPAQNSCRNDFAMEQAAARILADAKIIKAADELADMYDGLLGNVDRLQEFNLDGDYMVLKAYRAAVSERET